MLASLARWAERLGKRARAGEPTEAAGRHAEPQAPAEPTEARKKRKVATPPKKARQARSAASPASPADVPSGAPRVHLEQVSLGEGFAVLANAGCTPVSLGGWSLRIGGETALTLAAGTALDAAGSLLLLAPGAKPPAALRQAGLRQLRTSSAWTDRLLLHSADGALVDGEGGASRGSPLCAALAAAEEYYRSLVAQLLARRLFAQSPSLAGPSRVDAKRVRWTHGAREELRRMLEGVAERLVAGCAAGGPAEPLGAAAVCRAIEACLPACEVQRRALAEAARAEQHSAPFLLSDEHAAALAATVEGAEHLARSPAALHALCICLDYLLAELVETVATIAYSETRSGGARRGGAPPDAEPELFTGALDGPALLDSVRMDPDLRRVFLPGAAAADASGVQ